MLQERQVNEWTWGSEMPSVNQISNRIIQLHREIHNESLSPMKLQKLLYYAQGHFIAQTGETLFEDDFQAWAHGPVLPTIYHRFKSYEWRMITENVEATNLDGRAAEVLEAVVASYGQYDGAYLSTMTHREEPWLTARNGIPAEAASTNRIGKESMAAFFKAQSQLSV